MRKLKKWYGVMYELPMWANALVEVNHTPHEREINYRGWCMRLHDRYRWQGKHISSHHLSCFILRGFANFLPTSIGTMPDFATMLTRQLRLPIYLAPTALILMTPMWISTSITSRLLWDFETTRAVESGA